MKPAKMNWSPQQKAFIDWCDTGSGSCVLVAGAGCGKTTTLLAGARKLTARGKSVAIVAFNKKIARELKDKCKLDPKIWCGTVHSFGNRALKYSLSHLKNVEPDRKKLSRLFDENVSTWVGAANVDPLISMKGTICKLVSLAKGRAVIGHEINDQAEWLEIIEHFDLMENGKDKPALEPIEVARYARKLLLASIEDTQSFDFDDMLYLPLAKRLSFPKFDVIMIDEAQDTNPARRELVHRMSRPHTRVIAVGDPYQAIYGFTGADNDALEQITKEFRATTLPLTTTYRCPKSVVRFASQWVGDHLRAHDSAPEGEVSSSTWDEFVTLAKRDVSDRTAILSHTAILCRNNAPLVAAAFNLIRNRVPCKIEGRDIADGIKKLANRWAVKTLDSLEERLDKHLATHVEKWKDKEHKLAQLTDQIETLKVIIDQCRVERKSRVSDLEAYIDQLFDEDVSGMLVLCSIHKSKGLEWDNVYWLDRTLTCPSKWARKDWMRDQERNLQYVAATRAKHQLVDLTSPPKDAPTGRKPSQPEIQNVPGTPAHALEMAFARVGPPQPNPILTPEQTIEVEKRLNPYAGVLERLADQGSRLGRKQEPGRKKAVASGTSSSHNLTSKEDIDARFARGEIDKEERARLHKARRARERKQRA